MATQLRIRPITTEDHQQLLNIDTHYTQQAQLELVVTMASVRFFERSGHSFIAESDEGVHGFVLAQSVWNGQKPTVLVSRVALLDVTDDVVRGALLEAVTKSAYDAAVYDLLLLQSAHDARADAVLTDKQFSLLDVRLYGRVLGSRAAQSGQVRDVNVEREV